MVLIDTDAAVLHANHVLTLVRRLVALAAVLALSAGHLAACAGWDATPEARMACCTDDDTCPMHQQASHDASTTSSISQAQADRCCAASEGHESGAPTSSFALANVLAPVPGPTPVVLPALHTVVAAWRAFVPSSRSPVLTHLLLSTFLV